METNLETGIICPYFGKHCVESYVLSNLKKLSGEQTEYINTFCKSNYKSCEYYKTIKMFEEIQ